MKLMENKELLNASTNASETDNKNYGREAELTANGKELIARTKIDKTPFQIISESDKGHYIVMGSYRLTEPTETIEEQYDKIENKEWEFLTTVIGTIVDTVLNIREIKNNQANGN